MKILSRLLLPITLPLLATSCATELSESTTEEALGEVAQGVAFPTTPITIPGVSPGFKVFQTSPRTFVTSAYSNAVIAEIDDQLVMFDTMSPTFLGGDDIRDVQVTVRTLYERGLISCDRISKVINTHWHPDHIGGNEALAASGAEIYAGRSGLVHTSTDQVIPYFNAQLPAWPSTFWPDHEVSSRERLLDGRVELRYAPSHTSTDLVGVLPQDKLVVVGDLMLQGWLAFTDNDHRHDNLGTMRGLVLTMQGVLDSVPRDYKFVPGHNNVMPWPEAEQWVQAIRSGVDYVDAAVTAGKTLAQIVAEAPLPESQGGAPDALKALDAPLIPLAAFLEFTYDGRVRRDPRAVDAGIILLKQSRVSTRAMVDAIKMAMPDRLNAAGTEYDTLNLYVSELAAVDAQTASANRNILLPGAIAAFVTYKEAIGRARAAGRTDLTSQEYANLIAALNAL